MGPRLRNSGGGGSGGSSNTQEEEKEEEKEKDTSDSSSSSSSSSSSPPTLGGVRGPRIRDGDVGSPTETSETSVEEEFEDLEEAYDRQKAEENRSSAGYGSGNRSKIIADTDAEKEKNTETHTDSDEETESDQTNKSSSGFLGGIDHALNNPGETVDNAWRDTQKTWDDVDEGTKDVVDGTLDNDVFSVQDTIRGSAELALGYDSKEQFAQDSTKLAGTIKDLTQGKVAEGTALDNPLTAGVVDVGTFLGESFIAEPSKAIVTGLTGLDVDEGTAEGEVGAGDVLDVALTATGGKAVKTGAKGLHRLSKSDEAAAALSKLGVKSSDDGVRVLGGPNKGISMADDTAETASKATRTTTKASDDVSTSTSKLATEIENYKNSIRYGDEATETAVKGSDEAAETVAKASDEGESLLTRLTKTRKRKAATGATAAGATGILAGTAYDATVGFAPSDSPNTMSSGDGDDTNSDGNGDGNGNGGDSDSGGNGGGDGNDSGAAMWGQFTDVAALDGGWLLGYQQLVTGSRRRWFLIMAQDESTMLVLQAGGTAADAPMMTIEGQAVPEFNAMPSFETETDARNAHTKWLQSREYDGNNPDNGNQPDDSQWSDWKQVGHENPWFITGRSHADGERVQFYAAAAIEGLSVFLGASGGVVETPYLFTSYDELKAALDAYFTKVSNGEIPDDRIPDGSQPNREEVRERVRESAQTSQSVTKSVSESLTGKNVALAAVGVAGLAVLAGGGDGATAGGGA
ncbi:hypothetical protein [Haladaptatus cibarius]|uniref:hypothetical protein n=1 Tax=Haladaptatus cibarius TaxID=453847 RepID=UPI000678A4BA|nr:hypothetical protein [Haladaptatus cibarius]